MKSRVLENKVIDLLTYHQDGWSLSGESGILYMPEWIAVSLFPYIPFTPFGVSAFFIGENIRITFGYHNSFVAMGLGKKLHKQLVEKKIKEIEDAA